ncbi:MAG: hypothetical protein MI924_14510 [Chloroflexales bacterium]|nr:hypothetical protein [Chloroflexales bacterium]
MCILLVATYGFDPAFSSRPKRLQACVLVSNRHQIGAYASPNYMVRHVLLPKFIALHRCSTWDFFSPKALLHLLLAKRLDIVHAHHLRSLLLLCVTDGVVAPSRSEGFGIPLIKAMVVSRLVLHERNGPSAPYDDLASLEAAIVRLLQHTGLAQRLRATRQKYASKRLVRLLEH